MDILDQYIRSIPDFPKKGINFKDITTLLKDPAGFQSALNKMEARIEDDLDVIVGIESRGFIFGAALADRLGVGLVLARKPGKLPAATARQEYDLEYGTDALEIHTDGIEAGQRVLIVDDLLATGGTAAATVALVQQLGGTVVACMFLIELRFLDGRSKLAGHRVESLIIYDAE